MHRRPKQRRLGFHARPYLAFCAVLGSQTSQIISSTTSLSYLQDDAHVHVANADWSLMSLQPGAVGNATFWQRSGDSLAHVPILQHVRPLRTVVDRR